MARSISYCGVIVYMNFKICVVGCGNIANAVHGPAYKKYAATHEGIMLAACCDINEENAAAFQKRFGFERCYTNVDLMLSMEKPDAVCLISPAHVTSRLAVAILKQGYPFIMEKPPGRNREETFAIVNAAVKGGVPNRVAFNRRYMPLITELKNRLLEINHSEGIQNIRYDLFRVGRKDADFAETAIHGIDTVKFIADSDYKYVEFYYQELPDIGDGVVNIFMNCTFKSGATAQLNFCPVAGITIERVTVNLFDNTFFVELPVWGSVDSPGRLLCYEREKVKINIIGNTICDGADMFETNGFYRENESFFDDIKAGKKPEGDISTALQSVEIADCIRQRKKAYTSPYCGDGKDGQ